ncbi:MAG: ABC transporter permease, partial [Candidatus Lokiarchaeota archaeon]|nr:ABC transporter permease [Candidatus Lokiarchaeota archaeon]
MKLTDVFKYSASSIKTQKGRAVLTILGVVIGITAIVALNSLGNGFEATLTGQLEEGLSAKTLVVSPGSGFGFGGGSTLPPARLYLNDTTGLEAIPHIDLAIGTLKLPSNTAFKFEGADGENHSVSFTCVNFTSFKQAYATFSTDGGLGSIPTANDSIVVGHSVYDPYGNGTYWVTVGANTTLRWDTIVSAFVTEYYNYSIEVAGVLGEIGGFSLSGGPSDRGIYIPIERGVQLFGTEELSSFTIVIDSSDQAVIDQVTADIKAYYGSGAVSVLSSTAILGTLSQVFDTLSIFLTAIAAISLVVAGIGIMNIMTVSIIERTREIGILKAVGAKDHDILGVFLFEALLVGLIGSLIGIGLGYLGALGLGGLISGFNGGGGSLVGGGGGFSLAITPVLTADLILLSIGFGVGVAVIFALYP